MFQFLIIFTLCCYFGNFQEVSHKRVFWGTPYETFLYPHSSVITIRALEYNWDPFCSGVLITPTQALTAAHCIFSHAASQLAVGFGSTIVSEQTLRHIDRFTSYGDLDVAMVQMNESVPDDGSIHFFSAEFWRLDNLVNFLENRTYLCGYGFYEGPDEYNPQLTPTPVLRCHNYAISGNYVTALAKWREPGSRWPPPPSGVPGYEHDYRYMCSISRLPDDPNRAAPYFSTGCGGDSGGPVFYFGDDGVYYLQGIHHGGPGICGDAVHSFDYDSAVLISAIASG